MLEQRIKKELQHRYQTHLYRDKKIVTQKKSAITVMNSRSYLSFCSSDYLGLSQHPKTIQAAKDAIDHYGAGSTGSNLLSGHTAIHQQLEEELAEFTGFDKVILFPSGYHANLAAISTLIKPSDNIFGDKEIHASLIDGCLLSRAKLQRYPHQDINKLNQLLVNNKIQNRWIITDGLFSMRGDLAPLPELIQLSKKYNSYLLVDDAHGIGCIGKEGRGTMEYFNVKASEITLLTASFAKSFGSCGGFIASSKNIIGHLIQFARPYIYSNALSAIHAASSLASLEIIKNEPWRRETLKELISYFKNCAQQLGIKLFPSETPLQIIPIGNSQKVIKVSEKLKQQGILVASMRPPTVPKNGDLLRMSLTTYHTKSNIQQFFE